MLLLNFIFFVFDLDQTLLELFKVVGYTGEWITKGHIVPVHAYIRVLLRRLGYKLKSSGPLRTDRNSKKHGAKNYVKKTHLSVIEILGEIMDTIIYNGGKGGSLVNGLFNSSRLNLECLKDPVFVKSIKFLEPLVEELFKALSDSDLSLEDIIELCKPTLNQEEREFFTQCSRKAMPKQNTAKYIALFNLFEDIEKHNAKPENKTKFLIGMFSAGDGYMLDFLKQSGLERFFEFAVDFGIENQIRGAFNIQDENGTYPNVKCKPDHETFATVDGLILQSITTFCEKNNDQASSDTKVIMIDDNLKVIEAVRLYNQKSKLNWDGKNVVKITNVGTPEKPSKGSLYGTQEEIIEYISCIMSALQCA